MADKDDPFSGIRLSEQAGLGQLDQQLFTRKPPGEIKPAEPRPVKPAEPAEPLGAKPPALNPAPAAAANKHSIDTRFNLLDEPLYKATFAFTEEELEALEDLKTELRRRLDKKVTKYDLVRTALHMLFEDHAANREKSYASKKMRKT